MSMSVEYIAGFFDGEGCIHLSQGEAKLRVTITQTSQPVLDSIAKFIGFGKVSESMRKKKPHWKRQFLYMTQNRPDSIKMLTLLLPYLVVKKDKAIKAIKECADADQKKYEAVSAFIKDVETKKISGRNWWNIAIEYGTTKDVIRKSYTLYKKRIQKDVCKIKAVPKWMQSAFSSV